MSRWKRILLIHALSWIGVLMLIEASLLFPVSTKPIEIHLKVVLTVFVVMLVYYLNSLVLIPRLLLRRKILIYILSVVSIIFGSYFIHRGVSEITNVHDVWVETDQIMFQEETQHWPEDLKEISRKFEERLIEVEGVGLEGYEDEGDFEDVPVFLTIFGIIYGLSATVLGSYFRREREQKEAEEEFLKAELAFLKSQVNPHFFFNTLNNIYALIKKDPEKAREKILQLSKLMRHLVYGTGQQYVPLIDEIDFLEKYIELMSLRIQDDVRINFNFPKGITEETHVPPLLFVPFVENAFKHGVSYQKESWIDVSLSKTDQHVLFEVSNSLFLKKVDAEVGGVGLANVKRRLKLLYPENNYEFKTSAVDGQYKIRLAIPYENKMHSDR